MGRPPVTPLERNALLMSLLILPSLLGAVASLPTSAPPVDVNVLWRAELRSTTESLQGPVYPGSPETAEGQQGPVYPGSPETVEEQRKSVQSRTATVKPSRRGNKWRSRGRHSNLETTTVRQARHWTMEEPTPTPTPPTTPTRDYSGLYISPPIMVLDGNYADRDNTRVVHDVLVIKNRPRRPSTLDPTPSVTPVSPYPLSPYTGPPYKENRPSFWAGTAIPAGYGVSHAVRLNNHRPPSAAASSYKRPQSGMTSIHIYPMTTTTSAATTSGYPHGTIASVPLSVYDTVANTTIVHSNIITLSKPSYTATPQMEPTTTLTPDDDYFGSTTAEYDSTETHSPSSSSVKPSTTESLPAWATQQKPSTTSLQTSNVVAPIGSVPGILNPIGNLVQKFPTGMSVFQNIGRVMAVLPSVLAAFFLTALLFV